jgi:Amt family ammonium transporter
MLQWYTIGYTLAFSKTDSFFIGNFDHVVLNGVYDKPSIGSAEIPELVFCIYQGMFAAITPALAIGAAAERARFLPTTIFILLWTTLVYDFLAFWTWNPSGWSNRLGGL